MDHKQIISLLVYNHPGVLLRITGLITRRGFNIDSITAGEMQDKKYSRLTIVLDGETDDAQQVVRQVLKVADVVKAEILEEEEAISCELMLVKVRAMPEDRAAVFKTAFNHHAMVVNVGQSTMTLRITAMPYELDELLLHLQDQGVLELARTGLTALQAGDCCLVDQN